VDKQFILDAKHLISFARSLKQLSKGMYIEIQDVPFKKIDYNAFIFVMTN
jgi:hypothetical protein